MSPLVPIGVCCLGYLAVVLVVGAAAYKRTANDPEDYFLGGRSAKTLVLFMALFGTNVTPFVLLGIPDRTETFAASRAAADGDASRR